MRKIEHKMIDAIASLKESRKFGETRSFGNTQIERRDNHSAVYLHCNHLANVFDDGKVSVNVQTLATWPTNTTISRLRALGVDAARKRYGAFLNGIPV